MTKREMFVAIANVAEVAANEEMVTFIQHEIELLDARKVSAKKTLTKTQKDNLVIKDTILEVLKSEDKQFTMDDIKGDDRLSAYSTPKLAAQIRVLIETDKVVEKTIIKKKAYYKYIGE